MAGVSKGDPGLPPLLPGPAPLLCFLPPSTGDPGLSLSTRVDELVSLLLGLAPLLLGLTPHGLEPSADDWLGLLESPAPSLAGVQAPSLADMPRSQSMPGPSLVSGLEQVGAQRPSFKGRAGPSFADLVGLVDLFHSLDGLGTSILAPILLDRLGPSLLDRPDWLGPSVLSTVDVDHGPAAEPWEESSAALAAAAVATNVADAATAWWARAAAEAECAATWAQRRRRAPAARPRRR